MTLVCEADVVRRPYWSVLICRTLADAEHLMHALTRRWRDEEDDEDERDYWIAEGTGAYCAVCFPEPGCRAADPDEVAVALSTGVHKATYRLEFGEYCERTTAYIDGLEVGVIAEYPDTVADALGCPLDGKGSPVRPRVDLTPHPYPTASQGETKIMGYTARQWRHLIDYEREWRSLLDGATAEDGLALLSCLRGPDREARRVVIDLLRAIGADQLGDGLPLVIEHLRAVATNEPELHAVARDAVDKLLEAVAEPAGRET